MRESGTTRERIYKALVARYTADQEEALVKIDALLKGEVVPGHYTLTEDIDKLLATVASAAEKMATLRRRRGVGEVSARCRRGVDKVSKIGFLENVHVLV